MFQLVITLAPHYIGLTLPAGFFISLFIVVSRLSKDSEIDAILASGVSLTRLAAPLVALGLMLMVASLLLYGFLQPYGWYGYHAVINAAKNAGWSGEVQPLAMFSPSPNLILTADDVDRTGRRLKHVFIRTIGPGGREDVVTAESGMLHRNKDGRTTTLALSQGQQLSTTPQGEQFLLSFNALNFRLRTGPTATAFRARGSEVGELTVVELFQQGFGLEPTVFASQGLLAELYARIARAIALPLMPLLAVPLGLAAKRAGSAPAIAFAGLFLFAFETSLIVGVGLADVGSASAAAAEGLPMGGFAAVCLWTFLVSRKRPGENPVSWASDHLADVIAVFVRRRRDPDRLMT